MTFKLPDIAHRWGPAYESVRSTTLSRYVALPRPLRTVLASPLAQSLLLLVMGALFLLSSGPSSYNGYVLQLIAVYLVATLGLNITTGYAGALSLGQGAAFAIGAYVTGVLAGTHGWPMWAVLPVSLVGGMLVGAAIGLPAGRLGIIGLAMVSLGMVLVVNDMIVQFRTITGGNDGIAGIDPLNGFGGTVVESEWFVPAAILAVAALCYWLHARYRLSGFGRATAAVRDEPIGASALAIRGYLTKVSAFTVGSGLGALSGGLFAYLSAYIAPDAFSPNLSILFLVMVILGGAGSRVGPVIGTVILVLVPLQLDEYPHVNVIVYGLLLLLLMRLRPKGLLTRTSAPASKAADEISRTLEYTAPARTVGSPVLEINDLRKSFGGVHALDGVSLQLRAGEVLGLIGPNGSGKTTLLNVVCGHYAPSDGRIKLRGSEIGGHSPASIAAHGLARTFQTPKTFDGMSVEEHLALALARHDGDPSRMQACRRGALTLLELGGLDPRDTHIRTREGGTLSHGQLRFLEIATALASGPSVLLLDEPAAGLSATEIDGLEAVVSDVAAAGVATIIVEHHLDMVSRLVDRIVVLDLGKVLWEGPPDKLHDDAAVRAAYMGVS
ncbi:amino acid/amide ABC transporter membrane protein 2 [Rhodococcus ruber BKS 20-38]|uniref:Amino acid/amide ABC transporter membrane protein 2 n=1 Tax=Rhodococcus ruber BKS 20-38 TaxID=1278076 RepID=M2ZAJ3_9NOCA|nr:branched-chain amino acid ABC transporter ATP-binding protein/permease [Rhodococcus ruber]EME57384.1 amino acid/amide ABC transporter membrane protein 2 [Rhodococcus ruber BKS 20-38]